MTPESLLSKLVSTVKTLHCEFQKLDYPPVLLFIFVYYLTLNPLAITWVVEACLIYVIVSSGRQLFNFLYKDIKYPSLTEIWTAKDKYDDIK